MQPQENFSILLVDDDPTVVRILSRILNVFAPLRFATSGPAALKLARQAVPDLVLLDVEMPQYSGFEVCKAFKNDWALAEVPIIFITSHDSAQLEAKGFELGANDYIRKPVNAPLVLARVRTHQQLKTLRSAVTKDSPSGAANRHEIGKALAQECLRSQRAARSIALLLIEISGFNAYTDEMGEEKANACLKSVADALRSIAQRPADVLGRYANDTFALILPETDGQGARVVGQRAVDAVGALQFPSDYSMGKNLQIMVSVGGALFQFSRPGNGKSGGEAQMRSTVEIPDQMMAAAERALECARAGGQLRIHVIDMADAEGATTALSLRR